MKKTTVFLLLFLFVANSYGELEEITPEEEQYYRCVFINVIYGLNENYKCLYSNNAITETGGLDYSKSVCCLNDTVAKITSSLESCTTDRVNFVESCTTDREDRTKTIIPEVAFKTSDYNLCVVNNIRRDLGETGECLLLTGAIKTTEQLSLEITETGQIDFVITEKGRIDFTKAVGCLKSAAAMTKVYIGTWCTPYLELAEH